MVYAILPGQLTHRSIPPGTKSTSGKTVATKWQSFYPGIAVMVTVEGQYQNVRHFIRDVERSKQFVVINEVELQRATQNNAPASRLRRALRRCSAAGSGTRGSLVTPATQHGDILPARSAVNSRLSDQD